MNKFSVTYELVTEESAENGEAEENGFLAESIGLREAVELLGCYGEPSDSCIRRARWFTHYEYSRCYFNGETENRSLHLPESVTPSSRARVARLLGYRGAGK